MGQGGRAVRRDDPALAGDAEMSQAVGGVQHHRPVGGAAHHDTYQGSRHYTVARVRSMVPRSASAAWAAASRAIGTRKGEQLT